MNQLRGTNPYILDRLDLSLECIRRLYKGEDSPLYEVLDRDRSFYELFVDFKGYVDFFFLQDCVTPDYNSVIFWQEDCSLTNTLPLPRTAGEHLLWIEKNLQFINKRAARMKKALEFDDAYKNIRTCFAEEDFEYHPLEHMDDYYEILDEVLNILQKDSSLDVSTKRLRATSYGNGYARYVRINGYCCAVLFDKANWQDPDSVMTPFWLGITDSKWELSDDIKAWFDNQDQRCIASKWHKQPCFALVPVAGASFHQICHDLVQQIVNALKEIDGTVIKKA